MRNENFNNNKNQKKPKYIYIHACIVKRERGWKKKKWEKCWKMKRHIGKELSGCFYIVKYVRKHILNIKMVYGMPMSLFVVCLSVRVCVFCTMDVLHSCYLFLLRRFFLFQSEFSSFSDVCWIFYLFYFYILLVCLFYVLYTHT